MTREEAFDFLVSMGYKAPAVVQLGRDKYVLGEWLPVSQIRGESVLSTRKEGGQAVKALGEGPSWVSAMWATGHWREFVAWKTERAGGLPGDSIPVKVPEVTGIRKKTVKE